MHIELDVVVNVGVGLVRLDAVFAFRRRLDAGDGRVDRAISFATVALVEPTA